MAGSTSPAVHPTPDVSALPWVSKIYLSLDAEPRYLMEVLEEEKLKRYSQLTKGCDLWEEDYWFFDTCEYNTEDIEFSVFSSQKGGTDIKVGSTTIHVPEHCSVRHPAVQMVLFAKVILDSFYCPRPMVPRDIIDLIEKSSSEKCSNAVQTYKAGWADARGHSTKSHNEDAISHLRSQKVDYQTDRINWESLPVLFDVSITRETLTSKLPPSDETQEAGSMDTAGTVCKSVQLHCQHDGLDNSSCLQEPEEQELGLKNPNTYALLTGQSLTPGVGTSSSTSTPAVVNAGTVADFMQWHCRPEGEASVQAQEQEEQQCKVKNLDTYALATTQAQTPGDGNRTPALWLDSGAGHHCVGDASVLCNLRDPPAGIAVKVADGFQLPVTKIGDIQTENFQIQDVYLVPGLQLNVISVHQLAKCKICSIFYENHAELCRQGEQVGGAIADDDMSIYRLYYLAAAGNAAASTS